MSGFIKKTLHHLDAWQGSEYSLGSEYIRVLNMQRLHKVLKKCCIIDAWQDSKYSLGSEYGKVLNMPGLLKVLRKTLHYRYQVLNMALVLKWQGYREFCVNCILEIHSILDMPQVLNVPRPRLYQES